MEIPLQKLLAIMMNEDVYNSDNFSWAERNYQVYFVCGPYVIIIDGTDRELKKKESCVNKTREREREKVCVFGEE